LKKTGCPADSETFDLESNGLGKEEELFIKWMIEGTPLQKNDLKTGSIGKFKEKALPTIYQERTESCTCGRPSKGNQSI